MADNYKPNKIIEAINKTRVGEYKTQYIKSNTYLPSVFSTDLNKKWLDSTLDQMLSKGDLEDINAYVGNRTNFQRTAHDVYLSEDDHILSRTKTHLSPAVVSYEDTSIKNVISFDDISNNIKTYTDNYSYGAAYSTEAMTFAPPIDIDKFVNSSSYFWVPDMPIFKSQNTVVDFDYIQAGSTYRWIDASGIEFDLQNNQRIALPNVDGCVYMVTGVGTKIKLIKIIDENNEIVYDFETTGSPVQVVGLWDNADISGDEKIDWDEAPWDAHTIIIETFGKDYLVIDRSDSDNTAWSRNNNWVHINTIQEMADIMNFDSSIFLNGDRRALRPIIEFNSEIVKAPNQTKTHMNQAPLFRTFTEDNVWTDTLYGAFFKGSKLFGYKVGTGHNDSELGFPVVRSDTGSSSDIVFYNYLDNDTINYSVREEDDFTIDAKKVSGEFKFMINGEGMTNYVPLRRPLYVRDTLQTIVEDATQDIVFNVGSDTWNSTRELIITQKSSDSWTVAELYADGTYVDNGENSPSLILQDDTTYEFHNLIENTSVVFFNRGETPLYANGETGIEFEFTTPTDGSEIYYAVVDSSDNVVGKHGVIYADNATLNQRHIVYINNRLLPLDEYTFTTNTTTIPSSLIEKDDIVEIVYVDTRSSSELSESIPEIYQYNTNRERVGELTVSETVQHWLRQLESLSSVSEPALGHTDAHKMPNVDNYFGNILLPTQDVLAHSLSISDSKFDVVSSIMESAKDWWSFKRRLQNQVRRLWVNGSYSSTRELTDSVIEQLIVSRKGTSLYENSNMLFVSGTTILDIDIDNSQFTYTLGNVLNQDENISDHIYVYFKEDVGGKLVERILTKNVDYRISGNQITFEQNVIVGSVNASVTITHNDMDESCFVPPSLSKLYLDRVHIPQVYNNQIICHDGDIINISGSEELHDITSPSYSPVLAVIYDIENRVYAGLRDKNVMSSDVLRSAQHRSTWFSHNDLENDMMYRFYQTWLRDTQNKRIELLPDSNDTAGWSWNYSHIDVGGHLGKLPGHWRAAYHALFDTDMPHISPWHMLGHSDKPEWWDDVYSWTDPVKRLALISALRHGKVDLENNTDIRYARYYWNWETQCPVDSTGVLRDPIEVLVEDPLDRTFNIDFAQPFKFEDWDDTQIEWRKSPVGRAAQLASLAIFSPVATWNAFFIPGNTWNKHTPMAGDIVDVVDEISVVYKNGLPNSEVVTDDFSYVEIFNGTDDRQATAEVTLQNNLVSAISLTSRGTGYTDIPIVNIRSDIDGNFFVETKTKLKQVNYVSSGLNQVLYNYALKYQHDVSFSDEIRTSETRLIQKLGGFSSKHLLKFFADSSKQGKFAIADFDYDLLMYKGTPTELISASNIRVKKTDSGYSVSGMAPNKQQFYFYEADVTKTNYIKEIEIGDTGSTIKQYNRYLSVPSIAEYDTKFKRIQDVYNFIRGNIKYLEDYGYTFEKTRDEYAIEFANWATIADVNSEMMIRLGKEIKFSPEHGSVLEINTMPGQKNAIIGIDGRTIDAANLSIVRSDDMISIESVDDIGSVTFAVADFEHAALFSNITEFKRVIFDDVLQRQQQRLHLTGQRTKDWHGKKHAPGFLVFDDKIVQNWDSSASAISDYYNNSVTKFNDGIETTERLTNGNINRDWINEFGLSQSTVNEYYRGIIREKGTSATIDTINRTDLINYGNSTIENHEVWMFRNNLFGDITNYNAVEFEIRQNEIKNNQQLINFVDRATNTGIDVVTDSVLSNGRPRYVNGSKPSFNVVEFKDRNLQLKTAGDLLLGEADLTANKVSDIKSLYDMIPGTDVETWNSLTSYKRGDHVRLNGKLYECTVPSTGLNLVGTNVSISSTVRYPTIPYDTVGIFRTSQDSDYTEVTFGTISSGLEDITVIGSIENPVVVSADNVQITIDGTVVNLVQKEQILQDSEYPVTPPGANNVVVENTLDTRYLNINGTQVDLAEPNIPDIADEELVGTGTATDFELTTNLGQYVPNDVFDIIVSNITVDGVALDEGPDYSVDVSINTVSFTTPPILDAEIVVEFLPTNTKTFVEIKQRIESTVTDVFVFEDEQGRFYIRGTIAGSSESLTIGSGSANSELGLVEGVYFGGTSLVYVHTQLDLDGVISRINDADLPGVVASKGNNRLVVSSTNSTLSITGTDTVLLDLGIVAGTRIAETIQIESPSDISDIVSKLNTAFISNGTEIVAAQIDGYLILTSNENYLEIGTDSVLDALGIQPTATLGTGEEVAITSSQSEEIVNEFIESEWLDISHTDESLVSIWVTDDSEFQYNILDSRQVRFNGWNVYKFMNFGYYSDDSDSCSICAGTATADGNDAQITLNAPHSLQVGDYVMIHNSTTIPSVDGIHTVTRVDSVDSKVFYIDMYIEECGISPSIHVMRNMRFAEYQQNINTSYYRFAEADNVFVTPYDNGIQTGTYVYSMQSPAQDSTLVTQLQVSPKRTTTARVSNNDVLNIAVYDGNRNDAAYELEVFDPLRGMIPGVVDREIDFRSPIDIATYSHSTDLVTYESDASVWGEEEVGKVWWDTSNVSYYDYTQGDNVYNAKMWGKLFPGSSIDVYEWVRSNVSPDEWDKKVASGQFVLGKTATGSAYKVYNKELNEYVYYYTEKQVWDKTIQQYTTEYYFWVKNKLTIEDVSRTMTCKQIADSIANPTANGISWCAAISDTAVVVANVKPFLNNASTVAQINRVLNNTAHSSWTEITESIDTIPTYWYETMRNNLVGYEISEIEYSDILPDWTSGVSYSIGDIVTNSEQDYVCVKNVDPTDTFDIQLIRGCWILRDVYALEQRLPSPFLHEFNRYGSDTSIAQSWFKDIFSARRQFVTAANRMLREINMVDGLSNKWMTRLTGFDALWSWTDYVSPVRIPEQQPSMTIGRFSDLTNVNTDVHTIVRVKNFEDSLDRSGIYQWNGSEWILIEKRNATIRINDILWNKAKLNTWDASPWDSSTWDYDNNTGMFAIIEALRNDIFIDEYITMFNKVWFSTVDYAISENDVVDWVYKTTYIKLDIHTPLETDVRKYYRDNVNEVIEYVNTVKPFHTKIRETFDRRAITEYADVAVEEQDTNIYTTLRFTPDDLTVEFNGSIINGGEFMPYDNESQNDDWSYDTSEDAGEFVQPENYNWNGDLARRLFANMEIEDQVALEVTTDNSGTLTKYVQLIDSRGQSRTYDLLASETETVTATVDTTDDVFNVSSVTGHDANGLAYINGELIRYHTLLGTDILDIERGVEGTRAKEHDVSSEIVFLKGEII